MSNVTERMYQLLVKPVVTEKTSLVAENNVITFEVLRSATKPEIKAAIEAVYGVKVKKVNTLNQFGKEKRFKGFVGHRSDYKKAMVTLVDGQSIDLSAGV